MHHFAHTEPFTRRIEEYLPTETRSDVLHLDTDLTHLATQLVVYQLGCGVLDHISTAGHVSGLGDRLERSLEIPMNLAANLGALAPGMFVRQLRALLRARIIAEARACVSVVDPRKLRTGAGARAELRIVGIVLFDRVSNVILTGKTFFHFAGRIL